MPLYRVTFRHDSSERIVRTVTVRAATEAIARTIARDIELGKLDAREVFVRPGPAGETPVELRERSLADAVREAVTGPDEDDEDGEVCRIRKSPLPPPPPVDGHADTERPPPPGGPGKHHVVLPSVPRIGATVEVKHGVSGGGYRFVVTGTGRDPSGEIVVYGPEGHHGVLLSDVRIIHP